MIEASIEQPGMLLIRDPHGKRHVVSVFSMGKPQEAGRDATFLKFVNYHPVFVRASIPEVQRAAKRARTLRKAQVAAVTRRQLCFDFDKKREASAVTPTPQITRPPEESKVVNGEE
jgi:hypothetical protein